MKIDCNGKAVIDWFLSYSVSYIHANTNNKACYKGRQIVFGKFKTNKLNYYFKEDCKADRVEQFGNYLKELKLKYKKNNYNDE